jgi:hypothetical protein
MSYLLRLQVWTPRQASEWSGFKYRMLLRLIRAGVVPHILCAPERPAVSGKRIIMIPRVAFQKWLESIGQPDTTTTTTNIATTGETAA